MEVEKNRDYEIIVFPNQDEGLKINRDSDHFFRNKIFTVPIFSALTIELH